MTFPDRPEFHRAPSLADELAFEALPEETQAIVCRIFRVGPTLADPEAQLREAYEAGWEDAIANATVESYGPGERQIKRALDDLLKRKAAA